MAATQEEIDRVMTAYDNAIEAKAYAETLILEMQSISETDYKFVWTEG